MGHRHLGMLALALNAAFHHHQLGAQQRRMVACAHSSSSVTRSPPSRCPGAGALAPARRDGSCGLEGVGRVGVCPGSRGPPAVAAAAPASAAPVSARSPRNPSSPPALPPPLAGEVRPPGSTVAHPPRLPAPPAAAAAADRASPLRHPKRHPAAGPHTDKSIGLGSAEIALRPTLARRTTSSGLAKASPVAGLMQAASGMFGTA
jgi:hypothetical protein